MLKYLTRLALSSLAAMVLLICQCWYQIALAEDLDVSGKSVVLSQNLINLVTKGDTTIKSTTVEKRAKLYGLTVIEDSTFSGDITSKGCITITNSETKNIKANGKILFRNSIIDGKALLCGDIKVQDTKFNGDVEVTGDGAIFDNSNINGNLLVHKDGNKERRVILNNTVVHGMIKFAEKNGKVLTDAENAKKLRVQGGTIEIVDGTTK